jgi:hypothetical protein
MGLIILPQRNKKNLILVRIRLIELFYDLIDVRQIPTFMVVVKTITYDEIVFNVETSIVDL